MTTRDEQSQRRKRALTTFAARAGSLLLGLVLAVLLHYVLYRLGLPSEPFIYVAF